MPPSQGYGRSYVYDLAYVDGHVYMAGFTKGNVTFHPPVPLGTAGVVLTEPAPK